MSKVLMLVRGVARMVDTGDSVVLRSPDNSRHFLGVQNDGTVFTETDTVYSETLIIGAGGVSTGTPISLPNSGDYLGEELEVKLNAAVMTLGSEYQYVGTGIKTQIAFLFDLVENDTIDFKKIV